MSELSLKFSTIPFLFVFELLGIVMATRHALQQKAILNGRWLYGFVAILTSWGVVTTSLALSSIYQSAAFFAAYPTLWLPFIPVVLIVIPLMLSSSAREAMRGLIDATPTIGLVAIHALRITAVGTLFKAARSEFPMSFALWVGIPDLLFGLSALLMIWLVRNNRFSTLGLLLWNLIGVLVILPGAPIVGQMGLPGLMHMVDETPSMATMYQFPMVLAPSLVVPIFVMMNLFVIIRLMERSAIAKEFKPEGIAS